MYTKNRVDTFWCKNSLSKFSLKHFMSLNNFYAKMYFSTYKIIQKSEAEIFKMYFMFCTLKRCTYDSKVQIKFRKLKNNIGFIIIKLSQKFQSPSKKRNF